LWHGSVSSRALTFSCARRGNNTRVAARREGAGPISLRLPGVRSIGRLAPGVSAAVLAVRTRRAGARGKRPVPRLERRSDLSPGPWIGRQNSLSDTAIRKRAKANEWTRDLSGAVRTRVRAVRTPTRACWRGDQGLPHASKAV
jgi:hypothetical protein